MIEWTVTVHRTKYLNWYEALVSKAKSRDMPSGYVERHHVVPISLGGSKNDPNNIITLTAREHYIAHLLLWRISMDKKSHNKMTMALHVMVNGSGHKKQHRSYVVPSRIYEASRKAYVQAISEYMLGPGNKWRGKKHSEESLERMREWQKNPIVKQQQRERVTGENNPMYGKNHTEEQKQKISNSVAASWTDEKKAEKSQWFKEKWNDSEYKNTMLELRKTSEGWLNRDWKAIGRKAADVKIANGNNRLTEESKKKISETRKAKIASGEIVAWNKGTKGVCTGNPRTWKVTDPDGNVYTVNDGLLKFCKNHPISYDSLRDVAKGRKEQIKGWRCKEIKI